MTEPTFKDRTTLFADDRTRVQKTTLQNPKLTFKTATLFADDRARIQTTSLYFAGD